MYWTLEKLTPPSPDATEDPKQLETTEWCADSTLAPGARYRPGTHYRVREAINDHPDIVVFPAVPPLQGHFRNAWIMTRSKTPLIPAPSSTPLPDPSQSPEERARLYSIYLRPWTIYRRFASRSVPLLTDLDIVCHGTVPTSVTRITRRFCTKTPDPNYWPARSVAVTVNANRDAGSSNGNRISNSAMGCSSADYPPGNQVSNRESPRASRTGLRGCLSATAPAETATATAAPAPAPAASASSGNQVSNRESPRASRTGLRGCLSTTTPAATATAAAASPPAASAWCERNMAKAWSTYIRGNVVSRHAARIITQMMAACSTGQHRRGFQSAEGQEPDTGHEVGYNHMSLQRVHRIITHSAGTYNLSKQAQKAVEGRDARLRWTPARMPE